MSRRKKRLSQLDQETRVALAYDALQKMCPSLTAYARSYTNKKTVRVVPGKNTETDGKTIFIRPPLTLAHQPEHDRRICGMRGTDGIQRCEACALRERIMTLLHHEIAHISHGSFIRYSKRNLLADPWNKVRSFLPIYENSYLNFVDSNTDNAEKRVHSLVAANGIHDHVSMVHLMNEDHRINTASYVREPALWKRMHLLSEEILYNGIEMDDGTFEKWQDMEDDRQILAASLFYMEGFDIEPEFSEKVVNCIFDPRVKRILDQTAYHKSSMDTLLDAIQLVSLFREHDLLNKHTKPRDEMTPEESKELDEFLKALREILKSLFGHGEKLGVGGDDCGEDDHGMGPGDLEDPSDETVRKVIDAKNWLDNIPGHFGGINVYPVGQGPSFRPERAQEIPKASEAIIGKAVAKSRIALQMNARAKLHRDQKHGRVDARSLGKRAWNEGDGRLFKTKTVPDKRDYEVLIGFDISGSTSSIPSYDMNPPVTRLEMLKFSVAALADTMHRLGVKFSIYAHNTGHSYDDTNGYTSTMDIYTVKTVDEVWTPKVRERLSSIDNDGSNLDGNTLQFYRKQLDKSRASDKILMYFTDGMMPGMASREELPILQQEIETCRRNGYTLLGVGVFTDAPIRHGLPTVQVNGEADYPAVIDHLAKRLQKK